MKNTEKSMWTFSVFFFAEIDESDINHSDLQQALLFM